MINEITANIDAGSFYSSVYLTVSLDGKLELGPIWDFDLSMAGNYEGWWMTNTAWFEILLLDSYFVDLIKERYAYFYANKTQILDKVNEFGSLLSLASYQNDLKWRTIGTYVPPNPTYFDTYEEEVNFLRNWINDRMDWIEQEISNL